MGKVKFEGQDIRAGNIFCVGRNYVAHIEELNNEIPSEPMIFMKPSGSLLNDGGVIVLPEFTQNVHFECELVLLVGRSSESLEEGEDIRNLVAGYGVGLDLTARDIQDRLKAKGLPWLKAKGFRHSACVSSFISKELLGNPDYCYFSLTVNGEMRQSGNTELMMHPISDILAELSMCYGLKEGDLIFTGTPKGVGGLKSGDILNLDLNGMVSARFTVG